METERPVAAWRLRSRDAPVGEFDEHRMRRRQLSDVEPDALRVGDESERQIVDQRLVIQALRESRPVEQPLDLRRKEKGLADGGVVKGFLPRPITCAE